MRRIFTSTIFIAAFVVASINSFGQTTTCGAPSTSGTAANYNLVDQSTLTVAGGATATYNSPISYFPSGSHSTISFYLRLQKTQTNGGNSTWIPTTTIKWGASGSQSFTCVASTQQGSPSETAPGTIYYFTISPSASLPASVNFQLSVQIQNTGNRALAVTGFAIENAAVTPAGATLPVKFQSLDARTINSAVSLQWNVATEENLSGYSVEKSTDGRNFSNIGFVNAAGESNYTFVDSKPSSTSYYRIKSVDINGRYGYSTVALVKSGKSMIVLKAFPSPVIKNVSIQHPTAIAGNSITISSSDGRVIKTIIPATGAQQTDVDLSSAKSGLYIVRFSSTNGESETLKVLKQ